MPRIPKKLKAISLRVKRECGTCSSTQDSAECKGCADDNRLASHWTPHPDLLRECLACGYSWVVRKHGKEPKACPQCHSRRWNREPHKPGRKRRADAPVEAIA